MSSTVVHISFAIIIACSIIPIDKFSYKSLLLVVVPVAMLDLDALVFFIQEGLHRALLHNLIIPTIILFLILYDTIIRKESYIKNYYDEETVIIVSIASYIAVVFAGIGIDFAANGVNLFWPIHDQFYTLEGQFVISSEEGIIQTFTDTFFESVNQGNAKTTDNHVYSTPVNPAPNQPNESSPLILHIAYTGYQIVIIITSIICLASKIIYKYLTDCY